MRSNRCEPSLVSFVHHKAKTKLRHLRMYIASIFEIKKHCEKYCGNTRYRRFNEIYELLFSKTARIKFLKNNHLYILSEIWLQIDAITRISKFQVNWFQKSTKNVEFNIHKYVFQRTIVFHRKILRKEDKDISHTLSILLT